MTPEQLYALRFARKHKAAENWAYKIFLRALKNQVEPFIKTMLSGSPDVNDISRLPIQRAFETVYEEIGLKFAIDEYKQIKRNEPTKADPELQIMFLSEKWRRIMRTFALLEAGDAIQDITDHTKDMLRIALAEGYELGLSNTEMAKLIYQSTLGEIGRTRARLITRTETTTAANQGKLIGAESWADETGVRLYKKWICRIDGRERAWHRQEDFDKPIPKGEQFEVGTGKGGTELMTMPGDIKASGSNRCNCRCTAQYMSERKAVRDFGV